MPKAKSKSSKRKSKPKIKGIKRKEFIFFFFLIIFMIGISQIPSKNLIGKACLVDIINCNSGECITCRDSDGGLNYNRYGEILNIIEGNKSVKIESGSNKLNVNEMLNTVKPNAISKNDMPKLLADGVFKNKKGVEYAYVQKLKFGENVQFRHYSDSDYADSRPSLMVFSDRQRTFMTYSLEFSRPAESEITNGKLSDFEIEPITILGKTYDITSASISGADAKLVLMGGTVKDTLTQGAVKNYTVNEKKYSVEVEYIGDSKVKFNINGEATGSLEAGQTYKLSDGSLIGIREILEEEAGENILDQVVFYIGAEKLACEDSDTTAIGTDDSLQLSDEDISGVYCNIAISSSGTKASLDKINFIWYPDDKIFVAETQNAIFPGLNSFMITYKGFTAPYQEIIRIKNNGNNEIELSAPLKNGEVTFSVLGGNGAFTNIGSSGEKLVTAKGSGQTIIFNRNTDAYFIASDSNSRESHLMEVTSISGNNETTFREVSGSSYENKRNGDSFSVGDVAVNVGAVDAENNLVAVSLGSSGYFDRLYTKEGMTIYLPVDEAGSLNAGNSITLAAAPTLYTFWLREADTSRTPEAGTPINIVVGWVDGKTAVTSIDDVKQYLSPDSGGLYESSSRDYVGYIASGLGTKIKYDTSSSQADVELEYHGDESYADVFVSDTGETGSKISDLCSGSILNEAYCSVTGPVFAVYTCPNGCKGGACS